tara:strand:- start:915 stop:1304 length:390 start_codon:yes stop_codon:yes gene_type:complete
MDIVKIKGQFILGYNFGSNTGYISENGEVYIVFNGITMNVEEFQKRAIQAIGFTATKAKINRYVELYGEIKAEYGFVEESAENSPEEAIEEVVQEDDVDMSSAEVIAEKNEEVIEEKPKARRGRRKKSE